MTNKATLLVRIAWKYNISRFTVDVRWSVRMIALVSSIDFQRRVGHFNEADPRNRQLLWIKRSRNIGPSRKKHKSTLRESDRGKEDGIFIVPLCVRCPLYNSKRTRAAYVLKVKQIGILIVEKESREKEREK